MNTTTFGINPDETIGLLKERADQLRRGILPSDGRKVGLVVEGGAMRGVISCAALQGLEELGMTAAFDEVYAASAGAVNAAYFLAGQAGYATTIYYQKVNNTRFIRRLWHRQVVDLDELFETIVCRERPLRVEKVLASRSQFFVAIADAQTGESFLGHAQTSATPLVTLLKASSAMPLLYNGLVDVDGRTCFDGGLINPIPILDALENGCTDLLILLTRPENFRECMPTGLEQRLFDMRCARGNSQIMNAYKSTPIRSNALRDLALGRQEVPPGINIATICPGEDDPKIERTTRNGALLKSAAMASAQRTLLTFGYPVEEIIETLRPFPVFEPALESDDPTLSLWERAG
jgi:predicted patatin/cPLA2 family phospholipase